MKDARGHGSDPRGAHSTGVQQVGFTHLNDGAHGEQIEQLRGKMSEPQAQLKANRYGRLTGDWIGATRMYERATGRKMPCPECRP